MDADILDFFKLKTSFILLDNNYYCSFKSKKKLPHVIRLSPINGGFIQIIYKMLWQQ